MNNDSTVALCSQTLFFETQAVSKTCLLPAAALLLKSTFEDDRFKLPNLRPCSRDFIVEIRSTFHQCESSQRLHDCLQDAMDSAIFRDSVNKVEAIVGQDEGPLPAAITCQLTLVLKSDGIIACAGSSESGEVAIRVAAKRAERMLIRSDAGGRQIPNIGEIDATADHPMLPME